MRQIVVLEIPDVEALLRGQLLTMMVGGQRLDLQAERPVVTGRPVAALTNGDPVSTKNGPRGICPICGKGPLLLYPHGQYNHPGQSMLIGGYKCPLCPKRFVTPGGVRVHGAQIHKRRAAVKAAPTNGKK